MRPALLVFDGDCGFCTTTVETLRASLDRFPVAQPWQRTDLDALRLTQPDVERFVWLIDEASGRRWHGAQVFGALLAGQRGAVHRIVGSTIALPVVREIAAVGYDWVASHRHALPGGTPACALPVAKPPSSTR